MAAAAIAAAASVLAQSNVQQLNDALRKGHESNQAGRAKLQQLDEENQELQNLLDGKSTPPRPRVQVDPMPPPQPPAPTAVLPAAPSRPADLPAWTDRQQDCIFAGQSSRNPGFATGDCPRGPVARDRLPPSRPTIAQCRAEILEIHQRYLNDPRMSATKQLELFEGRCSHDPQANAYITTATNTLSRINSAGGSGGQSAGSAGKYYPPLACAVQSTKSSYNNRQIMCLQNNCGRPIEAHSFSRSAGGGMWSVGPSRCYSWQADVYRQVGCEKNDGFDAARGMCRK
jgi:hypothetical protein